MNFCPGQQYLWLQIVQLIYEGWKECSRPTNIASFCCALGCNCQSQNTGAVSQSYVSPQQIPTYPPTAAISIFPRTSFAGSGPVAAARSEAPAQNVATQVPATHPDPVMSPRILLPLSNFTTMVPSDTQSVGPVITATQPHNAWV